MAERGAGLGVAAEPYKIPNNHPRWFGDQLGSVAIVWRANESSPPAVLLESGRHFVVVRWGVLIVVGVYLPPAKSLGLPNYGSRLDDIGKAMLRYLSGPVIIAGDFNAKSLLWGSRRGDRRGIVEEWTAGLDLHSINEGNKSTFVGPQGESIIDLTWGTPAALKRVQSWRVADDLESLSYHLLIEMELSVTLKGLGPQNKDEPRPGRWALSRLDTEALELSLEVATWPRQEKGQDLDSAVSDFIIALACNESMPRVRSCPKRSAWW
ncbi:uncharacterized protein LOC105181503 [Harpegnathos saltator]|uniref:uncharacterized protein LOC105181503 n=1 Tax=Harpegnathos saltator TaxID=610380 RepID=UPI000DBEED8C|nr:uncharacterized protein LOC105181503 [Harpegnathos saltator]